MGEAAWLQLVARERHQLRGGSAGEGRGREEGERRGEGEEGTHGAPGLDQVVWREQPLAGMQPIMCQSRVEIEYLSHRICDPLSENPAHPVFYENQDRISFVNCTF